MELATVTRGNSAGPSKLDVAQAGKEVNKVKQITIIEIETHVRIGFSIWKRRAFQVTRRARALRAPSKASLSRTERRSTADPALECVILGSPKNESKIGRAVANLISARVTELSCD